MTGHRVWETIDVKDFIHWHVKRK